MAPVYERMFAREGFGEACGEVQKLWRARERDRALEAIPQALIRERTLVGEAEQIEDRLAASAAAGVDSAMVFPVAIPEADYVVDCGRIIEAMAPGAR